MAIRASFKDLNRIRNIPISASTTTPNVRICESNKLCSMLLYSTISPAKWTCSFFKPILEIRSCRIFFNNRSRFKDFSESLMRMEKRN